MENKILKWEDCLHLIGNVGSEQRVFSTSFEQNIAVYNQLNTTGNVFIPNVHNYSTIISLAPETMSFDFVTDSLCPECPGPELKQCDECKGSGKYIGLQKVEDCLKCSGKGKV
jgi:hypothetical protein